MDRFADDNKIPVVRFGKDRPQDRSACGRIWPAQARTGRAGVAAIGVAQEFAPVFTRCQAHGRRASAVWFSFTKANRRVTCYYFYLWDEDFGPAFVKVCAYFAYPMKIWVNGHEWAKRQATKTGIGFTELSNGFATVQLILLGCRRSATGSAPAGSGCSPNAHGRSCRCALTEHDRAAGYWWELSMRQVETSRTLVFDAPRHARGFFEALVTDNLDIGRPELIELIFQRGQRRGRAGGRSVQDQDRQLRHRGQRQRLLPALTASSSTSRTGGRCASRPSSTTRATWAVCGG